MLKDLIINSILLTVIGLPIASVLAFLFALAFAPRMHRWKYTFAGVLGGLAGEFCAVSSFVLSLQMYCSKVRQQGFDCNNAQADVILLFLIPIGMVGGCLLASLWTRFTLRIPEGSVWTSVFIYSGPSRIGNGAGAIVVPLGFYALLTWLLAKLIS